MTVSVAMISYNGEKYIEEQILSIVSQLEEDDELIISDDGSEDSTKEIVQRLMKVYPQIKMIQGPHEGVFRNVDNALCACKNDIIFLSDQDDVWIENKVKKVLECFEKEPKAQVIMHRAFIMSGNQKTDNMMVSFRSGFVKNYIKSCYWGCCIAMRRSFIEPYLPFGLKGVAHDHLIGMIAEKEKCSLFIDYPLCYHRYHGNNVTKKQSLLKKITFRIRLLRDYLVVRKNAA